MRYILALFLFALTSTTLPIYAAEVEISSYLGYTFSPSLASAENNATISVDDEVNFSLGFAWQETPTRRSKNKGQGQILINYISFIISKRS